MAGSKRVQSRHNRLFQRTIQANPEGRRLQSVEKVSHNTLKRVIEHPESLPAGEPEALEIGIPTSNAGSLSAYLEGIRPEYERKIAELRSRTDVPDLESA